MDTRLDVQDTAWVRQMPDGGELILRRLVPADIDIVRAYFANLSFGDTYFRYGHAGFRFEEADVVRMCHSDPQTSWHDIVLTGTGADFAVLANADCSILPDGVSCEFGILVAERWRGQGIARWLVERMAANASMLGARWLVAETMHSNQRMLGLARHLGFRVIIDTTRPTIARLELALD